MLSYELLTGRTPWSSLTDKKVIRKEIQTLNVAPPRKLSPPAGQFVCSLLRQDFKKRLGTAADADIKGASFFAPIDWRATEAGEAPPAFTPPGVCVADSDTQAALDVYRQRTPHFDGGGKEEDEPWFLGLDRIEAHPPLAL